MELMPQPNSSSVHYFHQFYELIIPAPKHTRNTKMMKKLVAILTYCIIMTSSIQCDNPLKQLAAIHIAEFLQKEKTRIPNFADAFNDLPLDIQQQTEKFFYLSNKQKYPAREAEDNRLGLINYNDFPGVSFKDLTEIADYKPTVEYSNNGKKLNLSGQYLTDINGLPRYIRFESFDIVDLSDNKLSTIPNYVLPALQHLKELNLSGNEFDSAEEKQIKEKLTDVEHVIF